MPLSRAVQRIVFPSLVVSFFPSMVKDTVFIFSLCFHHEVTEVTENEYFCLSRLGGTNKKLGFYKNNIFGRRPGIFWRIGLSPILQKKTLSLRPLRLERVPLLMGRVGGETISISVTDQ